MSTSTSQPTLFETGKKIADDIGDFITESVVCLEPCPNAGRESSETYKCKENEVNKLSKEDIESRIGPMTESNSPTLFQQSRQVLDEIGDYITEAVVGLEPCPHAGGRDSADSTDSTCRARSSGKDIETGYTYRSSSSTTSTL